MKRTMQQGLLSMAMGLGWAVGAAAVDAAPNPMEGGDIAAGAKWGACINIKATETSEVFEFLSQTIAHERLDQLAERARTEWSIDLDALQNISIYGADDDWSTVTLVARGDFSDVDLSSVPQEGAPPKHGKYSIYRYRPLSHISLLFAMHSEGVMVGGDTVAAVARALDVLDGTKPSYAEVSDQPKKMREQMASSVCVFGLDVDALKKELDLESLLFNGTEQFWFALQDKDGEAQAHLVMDHASGEAADQAVARLENVVQQAFETETTPPVISQLLNALTTQARGKWIISSATGSTDELVHILGGLQELLDGH